MLQSPPRTRESTDWLLVAAWTLILYAFIPFARDFQTWVYGHFGRAAFSVAVYSTVAAALIALVVWARCGRLALAPRRWAGLFAVAAAYAWGTHYLRHAPEEAMHFVEYGVLSLLVFRAFSHRLRDRGLYLAALLLTVLLGTCDEIIQWITPRRFWDFRDIAINASAGILMQVGLAFGVAPPYIAGPVRARSIRVGRRLAVAVLLVLFACVSNTPNRMQAVQRTLPSLRFLNETMIEYGFRFEDPTGFVFYSRIPLAALHAEDQELAAEAGYALQQYGADKEYEAFLQRYPAQTEPFLHEARVHLFRRDRYWFDAKAKRSDPNAYADLVTVAYVEQTILANHFGNTLRASGFDWPPGRLEDVRAVARPGPYESAVGRFLVTSWSERQLQALFLGLLLVTLLAAQYALRRERAAV